MNNALALNQPFIIKNNLFLKGKIYERIFCLIGMLSMILLSVFYIFQANIEASDKYLVQKYENELSQLAKENENLTINSVQTSSLDNIAVLLEEPTKSQDLHFEKAGKIHYIQILDTQFVAK